MEKYSQPRVIADPSPIKAPKLPSKAAVSKPPGPEKREKKKKKEKKERKEKKEIEEKKVEVSKNLQK